MAPVEYKDKISQDEAGSPKFTGHVHCPALWYGILVTITQREWAFEYPDEPKQR